MIRLPPSPTLFPYTTLFRSDRRSGQSRLEEQHDRRPVGPTGPRRSGPDYRGGGDLRVREEGRDAEGVSPKRHARASGSVPRRGWISEPGGAAQESTHGHPPLNKSGPNPNGVLDRFLDAASDKPRV